MHALSIHDSYVPLFQARPLSHFRRRGRKKKEKKKEKKRERQKKREIKT